MKTESYAGIRAFIHRELGIALPEEKASLLTSRLRRILDERGLSGMEDYVSWLESQSSPDALAELADAISTNHTFFYREPAHFDLLENKVLPEIVDRLNRKGRYDVRMWCAAASTGQEPYTLAMILRRYLDERNLRWKAGLLATDVSNEALETARAGVYPELSVHALPVTWVSRFFEKAGPEEMQVDPMLKKEVVFRRLNLIGRAYPFKEPFEIVFCRNVMIYFDESTRHAVGQRIFDVMSPGGYLFLGLSETLRRGATQFEYVEPGVFRKPLDEKAGN